jgi:flagellar export protein FliJ
VTPRRRRIQKILEHRQKELDDKAVVLNAVRAKEAVAVKEAEAAAETAREATEAKRALSEKGAGILDFIEAEEWLRTTARRAERAWSAVARIRKEVSAAQEQVIAARTKLKQAEQLAARVELTERRQADKKERRRDDEAAARIAQRKAFMAGAK